MLEYSEDLVNVIRVFYVPGNRCRKLVRFSML
jgi:hypothetical protein